MNRRKICQLLLVVAAVGSSGSAMAFRGGSGGGGFHHGGFGGGGFHRGGFGGHRHGGCCGWSVGLFFGPGFVYGYPYPYYPYYPYPYAYYPDWPVSADGYAPPTQYIEPGQGGDVPSTGYWYHCTQPEGYYPYIKTCPGGWRKVPAQPPGS